ncbi:MAG TPA: glycosyl hydrolase [Solirubrobacterales bacterium]|nr:glycosyl hydrolase [Solirubrobacterales bacterium]
MAQVRLRSILLPALLLVLALSWGAGAGLAESKGVGKGRGEISFQRALGKPKAKRVTPRRSIRWGALIHEQINGEQVPWDMGAAHWLERALGKEMSLIHFMAPFSDCSDKDDCFHYEFPAREMQTIRNHGATPFFSWSSQSIPSGEVQPDYQLSDVISGRYDGFIRQWARDAKEWGKPFFLRFNWEMNGEWFPWHEGVNGNQPGEYVRAWRHVHDIFDSIGATNPIWVWCPNVDFEGSLRDLSSVYPGHSYVEWTCLDGYNSGTNPNKKDRWRTFDQLYERTYREIVEEIAPAKPMVIGEIASTEHGGSKAQWIAETLQVVPRDYPKIRGLVWFDKIERSVDWPIETSPSALAAFAAGIARPIYR